MKEKKLNNWQQNNEQYLAAALEWLRLRLIRLAKSTANNPDAPSTSQSSKRCFFSRFNSKPSASSVPVATVPALKKITKAEEKTVARMAEAASVEPPPALIILSQRFGLSRFEQEALLLCAAMELDTRVAVLCAQAQDDPNRPYPTFALALVLFDEPAWDVLSPERPLRYWRLIEINQPGAQPLTTSALRADERIVNFIKGLNYLDDRLAPLLAPMDLNVKLTEFPPSQQSIVDSIIQHLNRTASSGHTLVTQLLGPDRLSKQSVACYAAASQNLQLHRLPTELLPKQATELETLARLWQRESILLPVALFIDTHEKDWPAPADGQIPPLNRFLNRSNGVFFLATRDTRAGLDRSTISFDVEKPTPAEQQSAWATILGTDAGESPALLAGQFDLNLVTIQKIAGTVLADHSNNENKLHNQIWDACLAKTRPRLDQLAQRLDPKATWEDIVVPKEQKNLLRQVTDQVGQRSRVYDDWGFRRRMNRGLGINALFAGDSGTGKTMAAEVIANDLRLNLYRIDLSAVVNKYIGETEKNLRRLFDAAEDGGAILFFDEADALFGKRSEVKDSHDRYANIEVNYLLQRMEAFSGLAILATNMKSALDPAFLRRLRFIVSFPFPGQADRKRIWQKVFPAETPLQGLDYDRLIRLNLTGGSIHNIALNAAFLAAQAGTSVTMPLVLEAARTELHKLDRPVSEVDFHWEEPAKVAA
ncbi:MAG: ATP-binding protein [Desulfobacteraceae bacterium]|nr:ATP-binding protein [Desulfobacteraceae bacterium]